MIKQECQGYGTRALKDSEESVNVWKAYGNARASMMQSILPSIFLSLYLRV